MIGGALKRFAQQQGMTVDSGVAYGSLMGYATTLSEGKGYKRIDIVTRFPQLGQQEALQAAVNAVNVSREYRVQTLAIDTGVLTVIFQDTIGTMKKLEAFVDWFYPLLAHHGATRYNICPECGAEAADGKWCLVGGIAYRFHETCADKVEQSIAEENTQRKEADKGSYVTGALGAFLGAALGAVVWALVLSAGYVASLVGLLIGWLADKGYDLCKGRQTKGKVVILILAVVFGVALGTIGPDAVYLAQMIGAGELPGFTYGDIPAMIVEVLRVDAEYSAAVMSNMGMGLLFAALGVVALLRNAGKAVSGVKFKRLK